MDYSPWGRKKSDTTKATEHAHTSTFLSLYCMHSLRKSKWIIIKLVFGYGTKKNRCKISELHKNSVIMNLNWMYQNEL